MFETFKTVGELLFLCGCNDSHSGNISIRNGDEILITKRTSMLSKLNKDDLIELSLTKESKQDELASRDLKIHREIYSSSSNMAIIHAHLPNVMALCITENKILPQDLKGQIFFPQGISIIKPKQLNDYNELVNLIKNSSLTSEPYVAVIRGYGVFIGAKTLFDALEVITSLEQSAKIWLLSKLVGGVQSITSQQSGATSNNQTRFDQRKRSAIPPGIGVMGRRTGGYSRR